MYVRSANARHHIVLEECGKCESGDLIRRAPLRFIFKSVGLRPLGPWGLVLLCISCAAPRAPAAWVADTTTSRLRHEANAAEESGAFITAQKALQSLQKKADTVEALDIGLRICSLYKREADNAKSRQCYLNLANAESPPVQGLKATSEMKELRATARYRAATLWPQNKGRVAVQTQTALQQLLFDAPETDAGSRALKFLRVNARDISAAAEADFLLGTASTIERQANLAAYALAISALLDASRIRFETQHPERVEGLLALASRMHDACQKTPVCSVAGLSDDLWYWTGRLHEAQGEPEAARRAYNVIITSLSHSLIVGSYQDDRLDDALYRLALLMEHNIKDVPAAIKAYERLLRIVPSSIFADDAAYARARLIGTPKAYAEFMHDFPGSALRPQARAQADALAP